MLSQKLSEQTRAAHQSIEKNKVFAPVMSAGFTLAQYTNLMKSFYGFVAPSEKEVLQRTAQFLPDIAQRHKTPWLLQDLKGLALSDDDIQTLPAYQPSFKDDYEAFGFLYVIEGSTLGGQMIVKKLKENPLLASAVFHYYTGYGTATGQRWKAFKEAINHIPEAHHQAVVRSANDTFAALESYMNKNASSH